MFEVPSSIVLGRALVEAMVDALKTVPGAALLVTPFVHLATATPTPITPDSVTTDFTEATFAGYAPVALGTISAPLNLGTNTIGSKADNTFVAGSVVPPGETIVGFWVDDDETVPTKWYMGGTFSSPVPITIAGDFVALTSIFCAAMQLSTSD